MVVLVSDKPAMLVRELRRNADAKYRKLYKVYQDAKHDYDIANDAFVGASEDVDDSVNVLDEIFREILDELPDQAGEYFPGISSEAFVSGEIGVDIDNEISARAEYRKHLNALETTRKARDAKFAALKKAQRELDDAIRRSLKPALSAR